jgi:uncharacterized protein (DUF433 family)
MMDDKGQTIHLHRAENGSLLIGDARIPLEEVLEAFHSGKSVRAVIERFPQLNESEVREAVAYHQNDPDDRMINLQNLDASWRHHEL